MSGHSETLPDLDEFLEDMTIFKGEKRAVTEDNCLRREMEEFLDEIRNEELTIIAEESAETREETEYNFGMSGKNQ